MGRYGMKTADAEASVVNRRLKLADGESVHFAFVGGAQGLWEEVFYYSRHFMSGTYVTCEAPNRADDPSTCPGCVAGVKPQTRVVFTVWNMDKDVRQVLDMPMTWLGGGKKAGVLDTVMKHKRPESWTYILQRDGELNKTVWTLMADEKISKALKPKLEKMKLWSPQEKLLDDLGDESAPHPADVKVDDTVPF